MKLELNKRTVTQLSADLDELPSDATPQVGGGITPTTTTTTATTAFSTSRWLCEPPAPEPVCTCACCP